MIKNFVTDKRPFTTFSFYLLRSYSTCKKRQTKYSPVQYTAPKDFKYFYY
jgi:hypothetical protein